MVISWNHNDDLMGFFGDLVGLTVIQGIHRDLMGINVDLVGLIQGIHGDLMGINVDLVVLNGDFVII